MAITVAGPSGLTTVTPRQIPPAPVGYTRAYGSTTAFVKRQGYLQPAHGASWRAYVPGTTTPTSEPLYAHATDTTAITFPHYADERGVIEFWSANPVRVEVESWLEGYPPDKAIVDCAYVEGLTIADLDPIYVNVAGDTMTGTLNTPMLVSPQILVKDYRALAIDPTLMIDGGPNSRRPLAWATDGKRRWEWSITGPDVGLGAGSDLILSAMADDGLTIARTQLRFERAYGLTTINGAVVVINAKPLSLDGPASSDRIFGLMTERDYRFSFGLDTTAEGTNSGANFILDRHTLAGGRQRILTVERQTGITTFGPQVAMTGGFAATAPSTIATTLAIGGKLVQPSPDAGNTLTWQANGFMVAGGGGGGVDIATGDARWVNVPGDSMTGALTITTAVGTNALNLNSVPTAGYRSNLSWRSNNFDRWTLGLTGVETGIPTGTGGDLLLNSFYDNGSLMNYAVMYVSRKVKAVAFHGTTPKEWNTNYSAIQHQYGAWRQGPGMNMALSTNLWMNFAGNWASMVSGGYSLLELNSGALRWSGGSAPAIDGEISPTLRWQIDAAGNMGLGITPKAWGANWRAYQFGFSANLNSPTDAEGINLQSNSYFDGAANRRVVTGYTTSFNQGGGSFYWYQGGTGTADSVVSFVPQMQLTPLGHLYLGAPSVPTTMTNNYSMLFLGAAGVLRGSRVSSDITLVHNLYTNTSDQSCAIITGPGAQLHMAGGAFQFYTNPSTPAANPVTASMKMQLDNTGTLTLSPPNPGAGQSAIIQNTGNFIMESVGGTSIMFKSASGYIMGATDSAVYCGHSAWRWVSGYTVSAFVVGSSADLKQDFSPLDPAACMAAVAETDWLNYTYKDPQKIDQSYSPEGETPEAKSARLDEADRAYVKMVAETASSRRQKGYVLQHPSYKVHDLFGLPDRKTRVDGSDLAVVACALQAALQRIAVLEGKPV